MAGTTRVPCPTCGKLVDWNQTSTWRPFCSERCRLIDLGEWLDETRRIPAAEDGDNGNAWTEEPPPR